MKTMKKVISSVLLICTLAALLSVSAFATTLNGQIKVNCAQSGVPNDQTTVPVSATVTVTGSTTDLSQYKLRFFVNGTATGDIDLTGITPNTILNTVTAEANATVNINTGENGITAALFLSGADVHGLTATPVKVTRDPVLSTPVPTPASRTLSFAALSKYELAVGEKTDIVALLDGAEISSLPADQQVKLVWWAEPADVLKLTPSASTWSCIAEAKEAGRTATVYASVIEGANTLNNYAQSTVQVKDDVIDVQIRPIDKQLNKGASYSITAIPVGNNVKFKQWYVANGMDSYVRIDNRTSASTTLTPLAATNSPIRLYAQVSNDTDRKYAETYIDFTIVESPTLQLQASPNKIIFGQTATVQVVNALPGESFTWTLTPSSNNDIISRREISGNKVSIVGGSGEGTVAVLVKSSSGRQASITVYVNTEADYGNAAIKPAFVTWSAGQGNLTFEVFPFFYYAYMDGKPITAQSGHYIYKNGVLTIKSSLLSQLSSGDHLLKVKTSNGNGSDGMVTATIRVSGTASSVYGDNAHVRGSAYNLYFNSTDAVKEISINNQYIDPANYTLENSGKRVTLKADFLNQLGYGSYTMKLSTQNGYTETANFRIVTANYAPATGDDSNLGAWMALMILSVAGAVVLIPKKKKCSDIVG